ncbi:hypothetical protein [Nitrosomonas sp. Is37]|nr:hypothetical protein [Nitrosomonas sp. Is37]MDV6343286.1 hypothetical protein [Nitrosomonas sp. Is37]
MQKRPFHGAASNGLLSNFPVSKKFSTSSQFTTARNDHETS